MIEKFYVIYDKNDFVKCCGTAKQLVSSGAFKSVNSLCSFVAHIKDGEKTGAVVIFKGEGKNEKYSLIKGRKRRYERKEANT